MNAYSQRLKGLIDQFLGDDYPIDARLHGLLSHLDQTYRPAEEYPPGPRPGDGPCLGDFWTQEAFFRQVLDTHPSLIYVKDEAGRYLFANQAVADLYRKAQGRTPEPV
jgi:PAS domain-containing protein